MSPVDWFADTWGGRVHVSETGSDIPDRHQATDDAAERNH